MSVDEQGVYRISETEHEAIGLFVKLAALATVCFILVIFIAVVTAHRWLVWISPAAERQFVSPYVEFARKNIFKPADPNVQAYLNTLVQALSQSMAVDPQLPLTVHYVKGPEANAFATLGGHIFVFEGLVDAVDSENSLTMVLGHEMAHVIHRDALIGAGRLFLVEMLFYSLSGQSSATSLQQLGSQLAFTAYSRKQEAAADNYALHSLVATYGHPGGATDFFGNLLAEEEKDAADTLGYLASHPDLQTRIDELNAVVAKSRWEAGPLKALPAHLVNKPAN